MARALIVGCGCRGRALADRLAAEGIAVRGTSRGEEGLAAIEAAGFDAVQADPSTPGTVLDLVGDVALVVWLLGSASGTEKEMDGIHGERLAGLLARLVDTPVRGVAYEASGSASPAALALGRELVSRASVTWSIPAAFIEEKPAGDWDAWSAAAAAAVLGLLA